MKELFTDKEIADADRKANVMTEGADRGIGPAITKSEEPEQPRQDAPGGIENCQVFIPPLHVYFPG